MGSCPTGCRGKNALTLHFHGTTLALVLPVKFIRRSSSPCRKGCRFRLGGKSSLLVLWPVQLALYLIIFWLAIAVADVGVFAMDEGEFVSESKAA